MTTFSTPAPITAAVDIIFGDITISAGDRTDTVVEVRPTDPAWALDVKAAEQVVVEFTDGKLQIKHPKLRTVFTKRYGSVRIAVQLPTGSDIQGYTAKGEYVVEGEVGACELKTANGDIRIHKVTGELRAKSATGNISVDVVATTAKARTAAGNIRVGELGTGTVDLYTPTGEVQVGIPEDTAATVDAQTSVGRVFNDLEAPANPTRTVTLRARTHGGNITLHRA
ncbi:DUF4097 family beta strand repeat-containing protein [Kribbella solani]|uniref:DUF4097 and DUF4098 domain-containing protein YvlB n=1 Tax=Kribbella solani TaxID=236067 RepID=A0A841DSA1_9ACTN|nr:DUF4097 family beta strand repeat-containing protein [Kribbella solani]MBB5979600.1 DUF4097 and DUF4098 domain-containing protein YvlB [Kribbella solani]